MLEWRKALISTDLGFTVASTLKEGWRSDGAQLSGNYFAWVTDPRNTVGHVDVGSRRNKWNPARPAWIATVTAAHPKMS